MTRVTKSVFIALILLFSIAVVGIHQYGLFPIILLFCLVSLSIVVISTIAAQMGHRLAVICIISISALYKMMVFLYPETLVGVDTDKKAYWTAEVVRLGSIDGIQSDFYSVAPLFHTLSGGIVEVTNVSPSTSFVIFPLLAGIIAPVTAVLLTRLVSNKNSRLICVMAGAIAAVSTAVVQQSYWPIAQTFSFLIWCIFILGLVLYVKNHQRRHLVIILLCVVSLTFSHKLPAAIVIGSLLAASAILLLVNLNRGEREKVGWLSIYNRPTWAIVAVSGMILFLHWGYVSYYIDDVFRRITVLLMSGSTSAPSAPSHPTAVDPVNPGLIGQMIDYPTSLSLFFERSHAVVLLVISGICWSYLAYHLYKSDRFEKKTTSIVLGGATFGVILTAVGVVSIGALNPNRPLMMIEPFLAVIISVALFTFLDIRPKLNYNLGAFVVMLLLFTQLFAAPAIPDYPNTPRYYLTTDEVEGHSFGCEYGDGTIQIDYYGYQEKYIDGEWCESYDSMDRYRTGTPLFNATVTDQGYETVAYRPSVDVYLGTHSRWELTWDVESELDSEYSRTYNNDGFYLYHNQTTNE